MSNWASYEGVVHPAKERVVLRNNSKEEIKNPSTMGNYVGEIVKPGQEFIYEGPCRKAMHELWLEDKKNPPETRGNNFRRCPNHLQMLRELNFKNEKEFLRFVGYDEAKAKEDFETKVAKVTSHELPEKVEAIKKLGGGNDTAGQGRERYGGFGSPQELK